MAEVKFIHPENRARVWSIRIGPQNRQLILNPPQVGNDIRVAQGYARARPRAPRGVEPHLLRHELEETRVGHELGVGSFRLLHGCNKAISACQRIEREPGNANGCQDEGRDESRFDVVGWQHSTCKGDANGILVKNRVLKFGSVHSILERNMSNILFIFGDGV